MKSKPPSIIETKEWDEKRKRIIKNDQQEIAKFRFLKIDKEEFIVGGIVYAAGELDTQGDWASAPEIWKAMKNFMIRGAKVKVMHKGVAKSLPVIECFQPDTDTFKGGRDEEHKIGVGDWYMSLYLGNEKEIFKKIEAGELSGFSMGGRAASIE